MSRNYLSLSLSQVEKLTVVFVIELILISHAFVPCRCFANPLRRRRFRTLCPRWQCRPVLCWYSWDAVYVGCGERLVDVLYWYCRAAATGEAQCDGDSGVVVPPCFREQNSQGGRGFASSRRLLFSPFVSTCSSAKVRSVL